MAARLIPVQGSQWTQEYGTFIEPETSIAFPTDISRVVNNPVNHSAANLSPVNLSPRQRTPGFRDTGSISEADREISRMRLDAQTDVGFARNVQLPAGRVDPLTSTILGASGGIKSALKIFDGLPTVDGSLITKMFNNTQQPKEPMMNANIAAMHVPYNPTMPVNRLDFINDILSKPHHKDIMLCTPAELNYLIVLSIDAKTKPDNKFLQCLFAYGCKNLPFYTSVRDYLMHINFKDPHTSTMINNLISEVTYVHPHNNSDEKNMFFADVLENCLRSKASDVSIIFLLTFIHSNITNKNIDCEELLSKWRPRLANCLYFVDDNLFKQADISISNSNPPRSNSEIHFRIASHRSHKERKISEINLILTAPTAGLLRSMNHSEINFLYTLGKNNPNFMKAYEETRDNAFSFPNDSDPPTAFELILQSCATDDQIVELSKVDGKIWSVGWMHGCTEKYRPNIVNRLDYRVSTINAILNTCHTINLNICTDLELTYLMIININNRNFMNNVDILPPHRKKALASISPYIWRAINRGHCTETSDILSRIAVGSEHIMTKIDPYTFEIFLRSTATDAQIEEILNVRELRISEEEYFLLVDRIRPHLSRSEEENYKYDAFMINDLIVDPTREKFMSFDQKYREIIVCLYSDDAEFLKIIAEDDSTDWISKNAHMYLTKTVFHNDEKYDVSQFMPELSISILTSNISDNRINEYMRINHQIPSDEVLKYRPGLLELLTKWPEFDDITNKIQKNRGYSLEKMHPISQALFELFNIGDLDLFENHTDMTKFLPTFASRINVDPADAKKYSQFIKKYAAHILTHQSDEDIIIRPEELGLTLIDIAINRPGFAKKIYESNKEAYLRYWYEINNLPYYAFEGNSFYAYKDHILVALVKNMKHTTFYDDILTYALAQPKDAYSFASLIWRLGRSDNTAGLVLSGRNTNMLKHIEDDTGTLARAMHLATLHPVHPSIMDKLREVTIVNGITPIYDRESRLLEIVNTFPEIMDYVCYNMSMTKSQFMYYIETLKTYKYSNPKKQTELFNQAIGLHTIASNQIKKYIPHAIYPSPYNIESIENSEKIICFHILYGMYALSDKIYITSDVQDLELPLGFPTDKFIRLPDETSCL